MNYRIEFTDTIDWKSFDKLSRIDRGNILKIIEEKIATAPERFGKPLRFSLKGYRRIRVGDFRIVYRIEKSVVYITGIGHRKNIY